MTTNVDYFEPSEDGEKKEGGWAKHSRIHRIERGVTKRLHFQDNEIIMERTYDAEPYLKVAAEARAKNAGLTWSQKLQGEVHHRVASIPPAELAVMLAEGWFDDEEKVKKWLRDRPKLVHDEDYIK